MSSNQTQKPTSATKANSINNGNKGSNMPWQFSMLQALGEMIVVSTPPVGGLATEATAISILNSIIASDQDIEILLVRDTVTLIVYQQITNYQTGVPVVTYKDVNGVPFVPVNPMVYLDPSAVLNLMLTEMLAQGLTLDAIDANTDGLEALLTAIDTVLDNIKLDTGNMLTSLATEATLLDVETVLDNIKLDTANLDVALSTRATEATLLQVDLAILLNTAKINDLLIAFNAEDFATETTLLLVKAVLDVMNANVILGNIKLDSINTKLTSVVRTPSFSVVNGLSVVPVPAGARSVTFANQGNTPATIAGGVLDRGESITFDAGGQGDTLGAIAVSTIAMGVLKITKVV